MARKDGMRKNLRMRYVTYDNIWILMAELYLNAKRLGHKCMFKDESFGLQRTIDFKLKVEDFCGKYFSLCPTES
jgi:hypothetical protein